MAAYVYLIEEKPFQGDNSGSWTKIGYSKNPPEWRMNANLKRGNPRDLHVAQAFEFGTQKEARDMEKKAHSYFKLNHHQKEWFNLTAKEISEWFISEGANKRTFKSK